MTVTLATQLITNTKATIYQLALDVATTLGLPVTSWLPGDPTRSDYHVVAEELEAVELVIANFVASGFLDHAEDFWLTLLADQVFDVQRTSAAYATCTILLTNAGGGYFNPQPGDITVKSSTSDQTYHTTDGGTLASGPGTTLELDVVADVAGSAGSASIAEINTLVTTMLSVTVSNTTAATAVDEESDQALRARCRAKLGSLSPNGPRDAYVYVATTPSLSGTPNVTRARAFADSPTGLVTLYLAGPSGAVAGADRTLVEAGIVAYATPLTITPTVLSATNVIVAVTYQLWLYASVGVTAAEAQVAVEAALDAMFVSRPIGGDVITGSGALYLTMIESVIRAVYPQHSFRVSVSLPTGDTALDPNEVAVKGAVTPTITFVDDP